VGIFLQMLEIVRIQIGIFWGLIYRYRQKWKKKCGKLFMELAEG
jgi:preprotein translocase subunit YajC